MADDASAVRAADLAWARAQAAANSLVLAQAAQKAAAEAALAATGAQASVDLRAGQADAAAQAAAAARAAAAELRDEVAADLLEIRSHMATLGVGARAVSYDDTITAFGADDVQAAIEAINTRLIAGVPAPSEGELDFDNSSNSGLLGVI